MERKTRIYLATAYQLFASLTSTSRQLFASITLLFFAFTQVVLAQQPLQRTPSADITTGRKYFGKCLQPDPREQPADELYAAFSRCMKAQRAAAKTYEAPRGVPPDYQQAAPIGNPVSASGQPAILVAAAVTKPSPRQQVQLDTGSITVSQGQFGISIPVSPGRMSAQDAQIYQQVVDKFACVDAAQQSQLASELKAISGTTKQLEHLKMWYQLNKDTPCSRKIGEEPTRYRIIEEKKDLPLDYRNVKWKAETRHDMVAFTQSHPDNAGCYGGWSSAKTEDEARAMIKACVSRPDYRDKYINSIKPGVISQLFLAQRDKDQFVEKLTAGEYQIVPAHKLNEVNAGLYLSQNFVEVVLGKDEAPIMVAEVEINTEEGFVYRVDLNPLCANFMLPVQDWSWSANQDLLVIGPQGSHDESFVPIIVFEKKFSSMRDSGFVAHLTLNAASRSDALHVFVRSEKFHNYGKTQAYQVVVHDQPPQCLSPFDQAAKQLVGPGIPIGNIAAGADGPAVAAVSEWVLTCTASQTQQVVDLDNLEYATSENAARAEAHAYLTVVFPLPPAPPAQPTSCAPSCFGLLSTTSRYAVHQGQPLDIFVSPDLPNSANTKVLRATISLDETGDDGKKQKEVKIGGKDSKQQTLKVGEYLTFEKFRQPAGDVREFLESPVLWQGYYTLRVTFSVDGTIITCLMRIWVVKTGATTKEKVIYFGSGVAVGFGLSMLVSGVTHVAILGGKPVGCGTNPACIAGVARGPVIPIPTL